MMIAVFAVALLAHIAIHEAAHAYEMRRAGIKVVAAGLGLPLPPTLRVRARGVTWTLSPWLLGAYVQPDPAGGHQVEHTMPYRQMALICNAGVIANLVVACCAAVGAYLIDGRALAAGIAAALALALVVLRRAVAAYLLPVMSVGAVYVVVVGLSRTIGAGYSPGLTDAPDLLPTVLTARTVLEVVFITGASLAIINALPLYPLDNGRVVQRLADTAVLRWGRGRPHRLAAGRRWLGRARTAGLVALGGMLLTVLALDALNIVT